MSMGIVAGGAALLGFVGSEQASSAAQSAEQNQASIASNNLQFQQGVYNNEYNFEQPMRGYLTGLFNSPDSSLFFDSNKQNIEQNNQQAVQQGDQQLAMSGRSDEEGLNASNSLLNQAGQLSTAYQNGEINKMNLATALTNHGQVQSAANTVGSAAGSAAGVQGQQANLGFSQSGALGNGMGNLMEAGMNAWQLGQTQNAGFTDQTQQNLMTPNVQPTLSGTGASGGFAMDQF